MRICSIIKLLSLFLCHFGWAQSTYAPYSTNNYHQINKFEIIKGHHFNNLHSQWKPLTRSYLGKFADTLFADSSNILSTPVAHYNAQRLANEHYDHSKNSKENRQPLFWGLYNKKPDLYHVHTKDFNLHVNPVLNSKYGKSNQIAEENTTLYQNTRGVQVHGIIDNKVAFYSRLLENQTRPPYYVNQWIDSTQAVPHEGFWKRLGEDALDYLSASGYVQFQATDHIGINFGFDRHKIGDGFRSMILSNFSNRYLFLKLNTNIWKLQYTSLFAQLKAEAYGTNSVGSSGGSGRFPNKYLAFHRLGLNITPSLNIGLFESVIFGPDPDNPQSAHFDMSYLNPIIFYRVAEQQAGSPDNAMLGIDGDWIVGHHLSFYGQFILDEFVFDEITSGSGWWGNKYSGQAGFHYVDAFGIKQLDIQGEYNFSRPYMYAHNSQYTNYSHYNQPLAHPLGANFKEYIGKIRLQPFPRLRMNFTGIYAKSGKDQAGRNWGGNIFKSYNTRERKNENDRGHFIGQGVETSLKFLELHLSYEFWHNTFLEVDASQRRVLSELTNQKSEWIEIGLRMNIKRNNHYF